MYPAASRAQRRPDVRALEGDDRRRRAGADRVGELLATDRWGWTPSATSPWRRAAIARRARRHPARCAIGCSAEHWALPVDAVARGIERAGSLRALDRRSEQSADHTLVPIEAAGRGRAPPSEALRAAADPDEPMGFGAAVDATCFRRSRSRARRSPLRLPHRPRDRARGRTGRGTSAARRRARRNSRPCRTRSSHSSHAVDVWIGVGHFLLASSCSSRWSCWRSPPACAVRPRPRRSRRAARIARRAAQSATLAGRAIGANGLATLDEPARVPIRAAVGARGVMACVVLRLASLASAGSIHLLCGAARVPFAHLPRRHGARPGAGDRPRSAARARCFAQTHSRPVAIERAHRARGRASSCSRWRRAAHVPADSSVRAHRSPAIATRAEFG